MNPRRCPNDKKYNRIGDKGTIFKNNKLYCNFDCMVSYAARIAPKAKKQIDDRKKKAARRLNTQRKMDLKPRTYWYGQLQKVINQWVVHIRDKGKPCCTCGTSDPSIKYDAGHCFPVGRGGRDPRRFEPTNLHLQCSIQCNVHGSGMRHEYERFLIKEYGQNKFDWLKNESNFPLLKDRFQDVDSIKEEISRYKAILKDHGLRPRT